MTDRIIGIDLGLDGAIAYVGSPTGPVVWNMPTVAVRVGNGKRRRYDTQALLRILLPHKDGHVLAVFEDVHAMPKQGVSSTFSFGYGRGLVEGLLVALGIAYEIVTPQRWKGTILGGTQKDKGAAILRAHQLFPQVEIGTKHGRAEALLLAEYGQRLQRGGANGHIE